MLKLFILELALLAIARGASEEFDCPALGSYPDPEDCSSYYVCSPSGVDKMHCPTGTLFDPVLYICQYADKVNCTVSTTQKPTTSTTTTPRPSSTTTPRPSSTTTPPPSSTTSSTSTTPTTTDGGVPSCPETGTDFIANPDDCTSFYVCVEGHQALNHCPAGFGFDPKSKDCVKADLIGCSTDSSTPQPPETPIKCPPTGLQPYPNPDNCGTFYLCQNGNLDIITCPVGYQFDTVDTRCERIGEAKCDGPVTSSSAKPHTTEKPNYNCDNHPNGSTFPDPTDCTKYYQCSNGHIVGNHCAPGLEFNAELHVCDKPDHANCHVSQVLH